ncbi:MAG: hypothetical protein HKN91_15635, partial [Acidimicrobiia bacterium]|nr:hypothetical protein [Acidimicrobiia bacterium]
DTPLLVAFYAAFIAFVLLSFQLVRQRRELAQLDYEREISDPDMDMVAGDAVSAPQLTGDR